jgi:ubiquitin fusion degradation protein 1
MSFKETFIAVPAIFVDRNDIDKTSSIILPNSAIEKLVSLDAQPPFQFKIKTENGKSVYANVKDFTAEEGHVVMPYWMIEYLKINPSNSVKIKNTKIKKGTYLKIQPHQIQFIELKDPKNILEKELAKYSCLTKGTTIFIEHDDFVYKFDILQLLKDDKECNSISIIDVDLNIDFERPLDKPQTPPLNYLKPTCLECTDDKNKAFVSFKGEGRTLGSIKDPEHKKLLVLPEIKQETMREFKPFIGNGRVLGSNAKDLSMISVGSDIAKDISTQKKKNKKEKKAQQ